MKFERLTHSTGAVADFYDEALTSLGALCERTWHDRLEVVAEGVSARLWNDAGALHEVELWFSPPGDTAPREAAKEVFPGCPLTFRLAEALRPTPLALDRLVLASPAGARAPAVDVAEKLWRAQFPGTNRWQLASPFVAERHFALLALLRCEIQAIDQHWSLRRVAVSLPDGAPDDSLAHSLDLAPIAGDIGDIVWPSPQPARWREFLRVARGTQGGNRSSSAIPVRPLHSPRAPVAGGGSRRPVKPRVKICCIRSAAEAALAVRHGANAIGLVSAMPSGPGVIAEESIAEIAATVPPGVATFLLTSRRNADSIIAQQSRCRVNTLQLCDSVEPGCQARLRESLPGIALVQVIHVSGPESVDEAVSVVGSVDALLLDSGNQKLAIKELGGTGRTHDWRTSRQIVESVRVPVFLAGGLTPENVATAIREVRPYGVDVCSGLRTNGNLDEGKVRKFFENISTVTRG